MGQRPEWVSFGEQRWVVSRECRRQLRIPLRGRDRRLIQLRRPDGVLVAAGKGPAGGQEFLQTDPERVEAGPRVRRGGPLGPLRRHVVKRSAGQAVPGGLSLRGESGDAEVEQLQLTRSRDHHLGRLQIPVDNTLAVVQGFQCLLGAAAHLLDRQRAVLDQYVERLPLDVLHEHGKLTIQGQRIVELGDVWMFQARVRLDLPGEAMGQFGVAAQFRAAHLHPLEPTRDNVALLERLTHPVHAQDSQDLMVADARTNFVVHRAVPLIPHSVAGLCRRGAGVLTHRRELVDFRDCDFADRLLNAADDFA